MSDDDPMRALARALFADPEAPPPVAADDEPKAGNPVPGEGRTPQAIDDPMREFIRALFDRTD